MFKVDIGTISEIQKFEYNLDNIKIEHSNYENRLILNSFFPEATIMGSLIELDRTAFVVVAYFNINMKSRNFRTITFRYYVLESFDGCKYILGKGLLLESLALEKAAGNKRKILNAYRVGQTIHLKNEYSSKLHDFKPSRLSMIDYIKNNRLLMFKNGYTVSSANLVLDMINRAEVNSDLQEETLLGISSKLSITGVPWVLADKNTILAYIEKDNKLIIYTMQHGVVN
jgi:hypothetical protein